MERKHKLWGIYASRRLGAGGVVNPDCCAYISICFGGYFTNGIISTVTIVSFTQVVVMTCMHTPFAHRYYRGTSAVEFSSISHCHPDRQWTTLKRSDCVGKELPRAFFSYIAGYNKLRFTHRCHSLPYISYRLILAFLIHSERARTPLTFFPVLLIPILRHT